MRGFRLAALPSTLRIAGFGGVLAVGASLAGSGPFAQGTQFRSGVDLIQIDVSVLDGTRRPVRDLTAADFTLIEDDQPQSIENFAFVDATGGLASESASDDMVRSSPTGFVADGRLVVIFMDDTTIWEPRDLQTAMTSARAIIGQLTPNDLAAVVFASGQGGVDYTNDRARLMSAVSTYSRRITGSLIVRLVRVAEDLAAVPDRRKILFYVGVGIPFPASLLDDALETYGDVRGQNSDLVRYMQDIFRSAQIANMNIYTIDPSGLQAPTRNAYDPNRANRDFLQIVAGETGGRAIVNLNEPALEVPRAFRENDSYYLLGYRSTNQAKDGKFRRVRVRVNRRGTTVRARTGYYALPPARFPTAGPRERARAAMETSAQAPDLPLRLAVAPVAAARLGDTPAAAVQLGFEAPLSGRPGAPETIDVVMTIYNEVGHAVETRERRLEADLRVSEARSVAHQLLERFDLKSGRYQVSIRAHARERDAHGSVLAGFTVPDFNRSPLAMSGVVMSEPSPPPGAPPGGLGDLWAVVPTTERVFAASGDATASVRIYQGTRPAPGPVAVSMQIVDERGQTVRGHSEALDVARFGSARTADVSFRLPLSSLSPGPYSLDIEATRDGQPPVKTRVAFAVRDR
jgi:VWFA-related protein